MVRFLRGYSLLYWVLPRKSKILKEKSKDEDLLGIHSFEFRYIDIEIEVIDPKTMLTHHTWIWNVFNISKEPRD